MRQAVRPLATGRARILFAAALLCMGAVSAPAEETDDLLELSLEDLMDIEVTSVSKRAESLSDAAAAITVITGDEIRRFGHTSIPEALRMVPGLHVAHVDANKWAVTSRGFNGRFANKLLVLIDGRSVYTPAFSGTYWEMQDVMLEDVDRIEVIRGPGGTMWGANAVNGVVNIITRSAERTQGTLVSVAGGNHEYAITSTRFGGQVGRAGAARCARTCRSTWPRSTSTTTTCAASSLARPSSTTSSSFRRPPWCRPR